ncbi:[protein-PII] uridylyltransferase [Comamonas faecalis]|uniref:Bifunctional uridylyltransferase/uridylyl-removing enzyme n=2 Tax=Comamonas faecalis TaxID=1387849 RepID=A0ABP7RQ68_9BURK
MPTSLTPAALRQDYQERKRELLAPLSSPAFSTRSIRPLLRRLAALTDTCLRQLWQLADPPAGLALVAVGGYGHGMLFPQSDVDVLVLLPEGTDARTQAQAAIERFIRLCWDAGLEIGSSVRSVAESLQTASQDVTVQTALLEARLLCGDAALFDTLRQRCAAQMNPRAFLTAKTLEMRQRHTKYDNTPYALEPHCKESPGGLRDLQLVRWIARAAGLDGSWRTLAAQGLATAFEVRQIERNEALLFLIRARLHLAAGRREDRLLFDLQGAVAQGFGARFAQIDGRPQRASEALMRHYYWAAKAVVQLTEILLLGLEQRLAPGNARAQPINARFSQIDGLIEVASDDLYQREPEAILETFALFQTTPGLQGLSVRTLRALYNTRAVMDARYRASPTTRAQFLHILQHDMRVTHVMRLMDQTSVLGRTLWPFRRIVGQMQHDLFHAYTVDQHILMVLRNARRFFLAEHAHEFPFCSQLAAGWDKPWVLYIAALFHDIAKGRGGDHSRLGAQEVRRFCRQHAPYGLERADAELIEFLVREHLLMSQVAQKQDLTDPAVIAAFAARVGSERRLTALYLLTVADIRGTGPNVWSAWKGKLLEDLYHATLATQGGRTPDASAVIESRKRDALIVLALHALPQGAHERLWQQLDVSYFMRHDAADIAWHTRQLWDLVGSRTPVVRARKSLAGEGLQVLAYAPDQSELFLRICAYFERAGFSILDARVHTTRDGHAIDTFQIISIHPLGHWRELAALVENDLTLALGSALGLPPLRRRQASRRARSFPIAPRVTLRPDAQARRWVITITAADRPGLLRLVARVLARHDLNVQLAKVSTLGERVEDVFVVQGEELASNAQQILIETELLQALA